MFFPSEGRGAQVGEPDCVQGSIGLISIDARSVFESLESGDTAQAPFVNRTAQWLGGILHATTRESLVLDELLFSEGQCYDPDLMADSERLLRDHSFIEYARISATESSPGVFDVQVTTVDRWSLQLAASAEFDGGFMLTGLSAAETNFLGLGTLIGFNYQNVDETRDLGGVFQTPRLAGTRMDGRIAAGWTRTGRYFDQSLAYPFLGDIGGLAFSQSVEIRDDLFAYGAPMEREYDYVLLPFRAARASASFGSRLGERGHFTVLGASLWWENLTFDGFPAKVETVLKDFGAGTPAGPRVSAQLEPQVALESVLGLGLVLGRRGIDALEVQGIDAVYAEQSVRVGSQLLFGAGLSRARPAGESAVWDLLGRFAAFSGFGGDGWVVNNEVTLGGAFRSSGQGRDLLGQLNSYLYWHPGGGAGTTLVARLSAAGGHRVSAPFQLTVGGAERVRGYPDPAFPVGALLHGALEGRTRVEGPWSGVFGLGIVGFVDVGTGWASDAPFGKDTGVLASVGAGLRVAWPTYSRRTTRIEIASPISADGFGRLQFRLRAESIGLLSGLVDSQMERTRTSGPNMRLLGTRTVR